MSPASNHRVTHTVHIGLMAVAFFSLGAAFLKLMLLALYFDPEAGALRSDLGASLLRWGGFLMFLAAAGFALWTAFALNRSRKLRLTPSIGAGISVFAAGICCLAQSVANLLGGNFQQRNNKPDYLAITSTVFCFLTAIFLIIIAYQMIGTGKRSSVLLFTVPILWSLILMVQLLMAYPSFVSLQADTERTVCAGMALWFLLDTARRFSSDFPANSPFRIFLLLMAPFVLLTGSLPYAVMWLLGVRDAREVMPYLALFGLSIIGFAHFIQIAVNVRYQMQHVRSKKPADSEE